MLRELRIENLLLIDRAELRLDGGLNVFTGETGAGKTMLAHSIDLLLGGKSRKNIVRDGASEAYVEGLFELPEGLLERDQFAQLRERLPDPTTDRIAVARRVTPEGRTRAYIEGRTASAADLKLLVGSLLAFYGQHEHRKLTLAGAQLSVLDGFVGASEGEGHTDNLSRLAALHKRASELSERIAELELLDGRRERELGLIEFELSEIEELDPQVADRAALVVERDRLQAVDQLRMAGEGALVALEDEDAATPGGAGASSLLAAAVARLEAPAGADGALDALGERLRALTIELSDISGELRSYCSQLAADPERLAELDQRLDGYERLMRKHGGSVEAVLKHAEQCREDRDRLLDAGSSLEDSRGELEAVRDEQRQFAAAVSKLRRKVAPKLAAAVRQRLSGLALEAATFEIEFGSVGDVVRADGCDAVEFMIAPNPGVAATALRDTASGGELSRVMLALLTAAPDSGAEATQERSFVFDEIDAGIGGHTARAVGESLRDLGRRRQVICITHLPQVAAAADRHFEIVKSIDADRTSTSVHELDADAVVEELCRMLGADSDDVGARRHAEQLLIAP